MANSPLAGTSGRQGQGAAGRGRGPLARPSRLHRPQHLGARPPPLNCLYVPAPPPPTPAAVAAHPPAFWAERRPSVSYWGPAGRGVEVDEGVINDLVKDHDQMIR